MKEVTLQFPNRTTFEKFMKYVSIPKCRYSSENLSIICEFDETYIKIAKDIFDAEIVE